MTSDTGRGATGGQDRTKLRVRQRLAGVGRHLHVLCPRVAACVAGREEQRYLTRAEHLGQGRDQRGEQGVEGLVLDQEVGELEELAQLLALPQLLRAGRVHAGHDPGHRDHDDGVHAKGGPVLRRAHPQRQVRRDEEEVVDEEAGENADDPDRESPGNDADHYRHYQDERRGRDAQAAAQREHRADEHRGAREGQDGAAKFPPHCPPLTIHYRAGITSPHRWAWRRAAR